jgi:hypothetical protein
MPSCRARSRCSRQYDLADPKKRLVVDNLEKRLNEKLTEGLKSHQGRGFRVGEAK